MRSVGGAPAPQDGEDPDINVIVQEIENRVVGKRSSSPEKGCLGCGLGIALVGISVIIWAVVYWYYTPEMHLHPHKLPAMFDTEVSPKLKTKVPHPSPSPVTKP